MYKVHISYRDEGWDPRIITVVRFSCRQAAKCWFRRPSSDKLIFITLQPSFEALRYSKRFLVYTVRENIGNFGNY